MEIYEMRNKIKTAYSGNGWKAKVDNMPDQQIIALYYSLLKQGKIKGV